MNVDYILASSLRGAELIRNIVMSYDIACQYSVKIWDHFDFYDDEIEIQLDGRTFRFMVPKFHLPVHVAACQTQYSLNFNEKVGRTDGEGIERGWGNINPIASSTREMGPGSRHDRLDQVLNDLNWVKVTRLGTSDIFTAISFLT